MWQCGSENCTVWQCTVLTQQCGSVQCGNGHYGKVRCGNGHYANVQCGNGQGNLTGGNEADVRQIQKLGATIYAQPNPCPYFFPYNVLMHIFGGESEEIWYTKP